MFVIAAEQAGSNRGMHSGVHLGYPHTLGEEATGGQNTAREHSDEHVRKTAFTLVAIRGFVQAPGRGALPRSARRKCDGAQAPGKRTGKYTDHLITTSSSVIG